MNGRLVLNLTPAACLSELSERGLVPDDQQAVYLAGSLVRGWGNATSDLDVYIVTGDPWQGEATAKAKVSVAPGTIPIRAFYVGDRRWDVEYWSDRQVDELRESLSWEAFEATPSGGNLTTTEILFVDRLAYCETVTGAEWVLSRRRQFSDSAVRAIVASQSLYELDTFTEDAVGMLANGDADSAVLAARHAFSYAVDALLASHGELEIQGKWRARRMQAVQPPELSFDEYWEVETMRSFDRRAPQDWVNQVLKVCQRIVEKVQL